MLYRNGYKISKIAGLREPDLPTVVKEIVDKKSVKNYAINNFKLDNYNLEDIKFTYYTDLRYAGQEHYVKVLLSDFDNNTPLETIINYFHKEHKKHYSFELEAMVELVNFHLVAEVEVEKPDFPKMNVTGKQVENAIFDKRKVDFDDLGVHETSFYHRDLLEPNMTLKGPAIIAENATTTVVTPQHTVNIDEYGNLILTLEKV